MIVVALDEGGHFEALRRPECMLISGIVFKCNDESDVKKELQCLEELFTTVCREQSASYPFDLHYNWSGSRVVNADAANRVKTALSQELPDYFRKRGRWTKGRPQSGRYQIFCMLGDQQHQLANANSNMRDDVATIRYEHMVYRTVENLLFCTPALQSETQFRLDLATRVIRTADPVLLSELDTLGYANRRNTDGTYDRNTFIVTDPASFRTSLESAILNNDQDNRNYTLNVLSINYNSPQFQQGFLYMADTICSVLQDAIQGLTSIDKALPALLNSCKQYVGENRALLWAYHPIDRSWKQIWANYVQQNWFDAMLAIFDIRSKNTSVGSVYDQVWLHQIDELICLSNDAATLQKALSQLDIYLDDSKHRNIDAGFYILRALQTVSDHISDVAKTKEIHYRISKARLGLYNHIGDLVQAEQEHNLCMQYTEIAPIEEFLGVELRRVTNLIDSLKYDEACELSENIIDSHKLLFEIRTMFFPDAKLGTDSYARALSQYGQCLAFHEGTEKAIKQFEEALSIFAVGSKDWSMTASYLLHALIEMNDVNQYEAFANTFFGSKQLSKQYKNIMDDKCGSIPFALFIYLKALWVFYKDSVPQELLQKVIAPIDAQTGTDYHFPMEMIYKYSALLCLYRLENRQTHPRTDQLMKLALAVLDLEENNIRHTIGINTKQYFENVLHGDLRYPDALPKFMYR